MEAVRNLAEGLPDAAKDLHLNRARLMKLGTSDAAVHDAVRVASVLARGAA
jgi:hypothetical protein